MERSGSQKALKVISIISIIFAILGFIGGVFFVAGGAMVGAVDSAELTNQLEGTGYTQTDVMGIGVGVGLATIIGSVIQLIVGILGVRAANDNQKIMPVWVLALIDLILYIIGIISIIATGSFATNGLSAIFSAIIAAIMFWICNNIKKQAGK